MVSDLRDLLHDVVRVPPEDSLGLDDLLASAKRRVRRRRAGLAAAGVACVVLAAAGPVLLTGSGDGPGPGPTTAAPPVGRVLHLADAVPAREGTDYDLLGSVGSGNLDAGGDAWSADALTPDGLLVMRPAMREAGRWPHWELRDPATDHTQALPVLDERPEPERVLAADRDRLVFLGGDDRGRRLVVWTFDRTTGDWAPPVRVDGGPAGLSLETQRRVALGPDDRLWFAVTDQEVVTGNRDRLWSVPLDRPAALRDEGLVGAYDITGSTLAFLAPAEGRTTPQRLHLRDLRTGQETVVDAATSPGCNVGGLARAGKLFVVPEYCGTHDGVRDDRVVVMTPAGQPVVTVQDDEVWPETIGDRFVGLLSQGDEKAGAYVYDTSTDRLRRLSDRSVHFAGSMLSSGDLLGWSTPTAGGHGMVTHTARFR